MAAGDLAYRDPMVANAYGPATRKYAGYSNDGSAASQRDMQADHDAAAIDAGRDAGSQEMLDESLDKAMGR